MVSTIAKSTNRADILAAARTGAFKLVESLLVENGMEQHGNDEYAIPVDVGGTEVWVTFKLVAHNFKGTAKTAAFDVFEAQEEWRAECEAKAKAKAIAEQNKAEKLARKKAKSSKSE